MRPLPFFLCLLALAPAGGGAADSLRDRDDAFLVLGRTCTVAFSPRDGAIVGVEQEGRQGSIWRSGEHGLWHVRFRDGSEARAADFDLDDTMSKDELGKGTYLMNIVYRGQTERVLFTVK